MRRRAAVACIGFLAGLAELLQYTLLQMAIVSDFHRSRQRTHLTEFLGKHVQLTKQPVVEKASDQKAMFDLPRTAPHYNVIG